MTVVTQEVGWPHKKVGELSKRVTVGFVGSMASLFTESGVPLLRGQNVEPYQLNLSNLKYISQETHRAWTKSALLPGDVVLVRVGYPGTATVIPEGIGELNAASLVIVRPDPAKLSAWFLAYILNSSWGKAQIKGLLVGSAQQVLNTKVVADFTIAAPSIEVQRRIASVLGAYDKLIDVNRRRIEALEEMARRLYEEWFHGLRFPGHEVSTLEEQGKLPAGGQRVSFGSLVDEVRDTISPAEVDNATKYVGLEHIPRRSTTLDKWGQVGDVTSMKLRFRSGDVLFGKIRPYFHKVVWAPFEGVCSSDAIVIRAKSPELAGLVLAIASSDAFVAQAVQTSNGTKMPRANWGVLTRYPIVLPTAGIATRFSKYVSTWTTNAALLQSANKKLAMARELLLPRLISGDLSVSAAERELESAA